MQARSEPETISQVTPDTPKGEEPNREAVNPKKRKYQRRKSKVKVIKPADPEITEDSALDKLLKAVAEEDENPEQRRLIRDLSEQPWLSIGQRGPEADLPEEQQGAMFAGDVWTTFPPNEQGEHPPIVGEMMEELAQRIERKKFLGGFKPADWEGDVNELFPDRSNPNWGTPLGPSEEDFKNYSELRNDSALDKLLKAVGDEGKRSEAWWWNMVDIFDDTSLSLDEQDKIFDSMGVTDEEHEEIMDRSAAHFDDEGEGRKRGGYGVEEKPRPQSSKITGMKDDMMEGFKRQAMQMGLSEGEISDIVRDFHGDPDNPKHRDLRQQIITPEWGLKIKDKSPNAKQDEIVGSYLTAKGDTEPVGEQVFNQFVQGVGTTARSAGGGRAMSGQGNIADIQSGWPKVQPKTERQYREQPELRNDSALNKLLKATEKDKNFLQEYFRRLASGLSGSDYYEMGDNISSDASMAIGGKGVRDDWEGEPVHYKYLGELDTFKPPSELQQKTFPHRVYGGYGKKHDIKNDSALSKLLKQAPNTADYPTAQREYWHSRGAGTRHPFTRFGFFPGAEEGDPALQAPGGDPGLWSPEAGDLGSQPWDWEKPDISGATLPKYWEDIVDIAERQAEMDQVSGKEPAKTPEMDITPAQNIIDLQAEMDKRSKKAPVNRPEMNIAAMQTDGSSSILREQFNRKGNV